MRMKTKRNSLSIAQKIEILKKVSEGIATKTICEHYCIHKTVVSGIKKNKENIETFVSTTYRKYSSVSRLKKPLFPQKKPYLRGSWINEQNIML